jgi:hypothetical protein
MESLSTLLENYQLTPKDKNLRRQLIKELYVLYEKESYSPKAVLWRKKENWKRYVQWLRARELRHAPETVRRFRSSTGFIVPLDIRRFSIKVSPIKTEDLYWAISNVKESGFGWLFKRLQG